jgi:hypothetical protein
MQQAMACICESEEMQLLYVLSYWYSSHLQDSLGC